MKILVLGGTRFFGGHMVNELINNNHRVTIATRGIKQDDFGERVERIKIDRLSKISLAKELGERKFDVICDNLAYCSNDVKNLLNAVKCDRYVMISTTAVYDKHMETIEEDFDPLSYGLRWCSRTDFGYDEIKRQDECALFQHYKNQNAVAVRIPLGIGQDDYTKRLYFYVEHIIKGIPMYVDNADKQMGFIRSDEAGRFIAFMVEQELTGTINGSSQGTKSLEEMFAYITKKTGKRPIFSAQGNAAPYNGEPAYSINTDKARKAGFNFMVLNDYIFDLLDYYISFAKGNT